MDINELNVGELVDSVLYFDALSSAAKARSQGARARLAMIAGEEYARLGAPSTWRPTGGTVSLVISQPAFAVANEAEFTTWVATHVPSEIETRVRPAFTTRLLADLAAAGDDPVTSDGLIIDGLRYVPGGTPKGISIRPKDKAKAGAAELAEAALDRLTGGAS